MRLRRSLLVTAISFGVAASALAQQAPSVAGARPACVDVTFAARSYGYGYNHLVTVHDGCGYPVACTVTTDVNPQPSRVVVARNATETVTTFVGSPARVFVPTVACTEAR